MKEVYRAKILENSAITNNIYNLILETETTQKAHAGQFAAIYTGNAACLLPRPLSICEINRQNNTLRIIYRIEGQGTKEIAAAKTGQFLRILSPLGNGFTIDAALNNFAIVGGGIGTPPMLELAKSIRQAQPDAVISVYLGFRNAEQVILQDDFNKYANSVHISTDDGSFGEKGNILTMMEGTVFDAIYGCGPKVMIKHLANLAEKVSTPCYVSLEERMACCIGACLGCVTKIKKEGSAYYEKVCAAGPVFDAKELIWSGH